MTKQTSIDALLNQIQTGKLEGNLAKVLDYIIKNPRATRVEIAKDLSLLENSLNPTLSKLEDLGVVRTLATTIRRGSSMGCYEYVDDPKTREGLADIREYDKAISWFKSGLKNHKQYIPEAMIHIMEVQIKSMTPF